jgi:hypothetical protein
MISKSDMIQGGEGALGGKPPPTLPQLSLAGPYSWGSPITSAK